MIYGLTLETLTKIVADDIFFIIIIIFGENKTCHFMWIVCSACDLNEIPNLIFSEKKKVNK